MIAECIAILAVVAQISASGCECGLSSTVLPTSSNSQYPPVVLVSSGSSGNSFGDPSFSAITKNLIAKGKYPVALKNCGPTPDLQVPVTTFRVTAPVQEKPTVRLPNSIPAPKTISHSCTCYKTIMRPRVHQQIITVPTLQRYLETSHKPVVENIQYEALPVNCGGAGVQFLQVGAASSSSGAVDLVSVGSGCSCGSQIQAIEIPSVQTVHLPQIQTIQSVPFGSCSCQC